MGANLSPALATFKLIYGSCRKYGVFVRNDTLHALFIVTCSIKVPEPWVILPYTYWRLKNNSKNIKEMCNLGLGCSNKV